MHLSPPRCTAHPAEIARWSCVGCGGELCPDCVFLMPAGHGSVVACVQCEALAQPVRVERSAIHPFSTELAPALKTLLRPGALALLVLVAATVQTLASFEGAWWVLAQALLWSWAAWCSRRAAHKYPPFTALTTDDLKGAWLTVLPRMAVSIGFLGAISAFIMDWGQSSAPPALAILIAALAALLLPVALTFSVIEGAGSRWLAPWQLAAPIAQLGGQAWPLYLASTLFAASAAASSMQAPFAVREGDTHLGTHLMEAFELRLVAVFSLAALAALAGRFVLSRALELGHGDEALQSVTIEAGLAPRGRRR